jgi:hypothetical protein
VAVTDLASSPAGLSLSVPTASLVTGAALVDAPMATLAITAPPITIAGGATVPVATVTTIVSATPARHITIDVVRRTLEYQA